MHFDIRLWRMTAGLRGRIVLGIVLGLLALAIGIARFAFLGQFMARLFAGAPGAALAIPLVATLVAILLRPWLDHVRTSVAHRTAARVQEALRGRLYDKIVALGPAWFGAERTGGVMLSVVDGVEQLQAWFGQYLPQVAIAACAPFAIFAFMAWWDVPVAMVMLAAALFSLTAPAVVHKRTGHASRERMRAFKIFGEELLDAIQGLPTLKAFGQSSSYGRMLAEKARDLSESTMMVLGTSVLTRGITDLGCALGAAAALALGAYRVRQGEMSLEALLIVLMAGTEIFRPLRELRTVLHQGLTGQAAANAINALIDEPITGPGAPTSTLPRFAGEGMLGGSPASTSSPSALLIRAGVARRIRVCPSALRPASASAWWGQAARASQRSCACCCACMILRPALCASAITTCARWRLRRSDA